MVDLAFQEVLCLLQGGEQAGWSRDKCSPWQRSVQHFTLYSGLQPGLSRLLSPRDFSMVEFAFQELLRLLQGAKRKRT